MIGTKWATYGYHTEDSQCKNWKSAKFHSSLDLFNEILSWIQILFSFQEVPADNSQFTDVSTTWDIRAVSIEGTVSPYEPYARVLFHLQGQDWMSKRQPLPCVSLHVFHQAQVVHRACHLQVGTICMFTLSQIVEKLSTWLSDGLESKVWLWLFGCILLKTVEVNTWKWGEVMWCKLLGGSRRSWTIYDDIWIIMDHLYDDLIPQASGMICVVKSHAINPRNPWF